MRFYLTPDGAPAVNYKDDEIEQIAADELARCAEKPTVKQPVADLERFIEGHLKVADLDLYAALPAGVLGLTRFRAAQAPLMLISGELTTAAVDQPNGVSYGRWRATLAHEAAHVLLHRYLFDPELVRAQQADWRGNELPRLGEVSCLHRDVEQPRSRDWREVQANKGMAALLMPKTIFKRIAHRHIDATAGALTTGSPAARDLAQALADAFQVSKQAAAIRLVTTGIVTET